MMNHKRVCFLFFLFMSLLYLSCGPKLEFLELPIGGNFEVTNREGQRLSLKNFSEPVLLVFFGYTYCPDYCPNTLSKIQQTTKSFSEEERKLFRVVFISIDPVRDSSETVDAYVKFYLPNSSGYSFDANTTANIVKQYAAYVEKTPDGLGFDHSTYIYVLDRIRKTRKLIKSTDSADVIRDSILYLGGNSVQTK